MARLLIGGSGRGQPVRRSDPRVRLDLIHIAWRESASGPGVPIAASSSVPLGHQDGEGACQGDVLQDDLQHRRERTASNIPVGPQHSPQKASQIITTSAEVDRLPGQRGARSGCSSRPGSSREAKTTVQGRQSGSRSRKARSTGRANADHAADVRDEVAEEVSTPHSIGNFTPNAQRTSWSVRPRSGWSRPSPGGNWSWPR